MFEKRLSLQQRCDLLTDMVIIGFFLGFAFLVNKGIRITGLYMDDLYMWSCYGEQSFREYVFPLGSTRFRPVYWFIAWLQLGILKSHIAYIVPMNILFSVLLAALLYFFARRLAGTRIVAVVVGILFLASRFSYYNIAQLLGLMEALALLFVFLILRDLYLYILKGESRHFYYPLLYYLLLCFTHERFMVLIPMFFFALAVRKCKNPVSYLAALFSFLIVQLIRSLTIGSVLPAGTGGTNVADTFHIKGFLHNIGEEILYLVGINRGPEHLNGMPWGQTPLFFKICIVIALCLLMVYLGMYLYFGLQTARDEKKLGRDLALHLLFLGFIGAGIVSSAVTIRVEMRWIYAPYMCLLLYLAYMHGRIRRHLMHKKTAARFVPLVVLCLWAVCSLPFELYSHTRYEYIYLFPNQARYNSLADVTYGKYKEGIFGKTIYIIGNRFAMSEFTAKTFFKVYTKADPDKEVKLIHVDSIRDLPTLKENMLVLQEDYEHNAFTDITLAAREMKLRAIEGYYADGWMDERASIEVMSGNTGKIKLEFLYPGELQGGEAVRIRYGEALVEHALKDNISELSLTVEPNRIVRLDFENNFYLPDAQEQRGEYRFSMLVHVGSE